MLAADGYGSRYKWADSIELTHASIAHLIAFGDPGAQDHPGALRWGAGFRHPMGTKKGW